MGPPGTTSTPSQEGGPKAPRFPSANHRRLHPLTLPSPPPVAFTVLEGPRLLKFWRTPGTPPVTLRAQHPLCPDPLSRAQSRPLTPAPRRCTPPDKTCPPHPRDAARPLARGPGWGPAPTGRAPVPAPKRGRVRLGRGMGRGGEGPRRRAAPRVPRWVPSAAPCPARLSVFPGRGLTPGAAVRGFLESPPPPGSRNRGGGVGAGAHVTGRGGA